ncbi:MAG TPA: M28 family peptidase [Candidatus Krumholzibacteria bacterium]|nr:M28 family peptidase [Candidatus Krumholzibacteria bacterium]
MTPLTRRLALGIVTLALAAALNTGAACADDARDRAMATIDGDKMLADIKELSSDAYQGRMPATVGEEKTLAYLTSRLRELKIAAPPGGYLQKVPLIQKRVKSSTKLSVSGADGTQPLLLGDNVLIKCTSTAPHVSIPKNDLVFVGYGIKADEVGWNDFASVDVKGKTAVMLMCDPRGAADSLYFHGRALSQHGYSLQKIEDAARLGARGVIIIHDQQAIGYPWAAIASRATRPYFERVRDKTSPPAPAFSMVMDHAAADAMFKRAGKNLAALEKDACNKGFVAQPLGLSLSGEVDVDVASKPSNNVAGVIRGSERPNEYVLFSAHWDHVGIGAPVAGDSIYNGAVDNASGSAALLALARAYSALPMPPKRSLVFLWTTAEEQGLLGAYHYADHPIFPLSSTMADINMDALFPFGPYNGMTVVGLGSSELEDYMRDAAAQFGRKLIDDPNPEYGAFFRSDHYPFARKGVPAIFAIGGPLDTPPPDPALSARFDDYLKNKYHRPSDEVRDDWDMRGITDDVKIYFLTGYAIAQDAREPNWYFGSEFRPLCDRLRSTAHH